MSQRNVSRYGATRASKNTAGAARMRQQIASKDEATNASEMQLIIKILVNT